MQTNDNAYIKNWIGVNSIYWLANLVGYNDYKIDIEIMLVS